MEYIVELLSDFRLDLLCITETWLFESDAGIIEMALPMNHALLRVPRSLWMNGRGGEVAVIYSLVLSNTFDLNVLSFEYQYSIWQ